MNVKISPARRAAFDVLRRIEAEKAFSAILLPAYEENLSPADRALCHELTLGVLRNQIFLDRLIENFSGKKIARLDLPVVLALRLGLYQLRFLSKIPARAAVNEAVNLIYAARLRSAAGFVNAVLRKAERAPDFNPHHEIENPLEKLSVETSHPIWLLEKWTADFGVDAAAKLACVNNSAPPTAFRVIDAADETILDELKQAGAELTASEIAPGAWRAAGATQKLREMVAAARIYLQDEASQLVAHACSVKENESFFDVCAAPGSKTTLVSNRNAKISNLRVAGDFTAPRIKILRETVRQFAPDKIQIVRYDAERALPFAAESFDCALVDAPCSGTGTIRHNPEIRWHLRAEDFAELAAKQFRILTNAARLVKMGGRIVYSTCSLEREENEAVIEKFLAENLMFEKSDINLPERFLTSENVARTFPPRDDADGFFIAILERQK